MEVSKGMNAKVLDAFATISLLPSCSVSTLASTKASLFPAARHRRDRKANVQSRGAGMKLVLDGNDVLTLRRHGGSRAFACVVGESHQNAGVDQSVLLFKRRSDVDLRFTPSVAKGDEFDSQRVDESCALEDLLYEGVIGFDHGAAAIAPCFQARNPLTQIHDEAHFHRKLYV